LKLGVRRLRVGCIEKRIFELELQHQRADTKQRNPGSSLNLISDQQARISLPMLVI
jgi:hypothetical protein